MKLIFLLALLLAAALLAYSFYRDRQPSRRPGQKNKVSKIKISGKLLQAVKGDRALAQRLLEGAQCKYPNKSHQWYVEKVIYDIERDGAGSSFRRR